jgi:CheY-like chemotaxis protein
VRRLVELHGGTVEAKSEGKGKGSEFIVRVPVTQERSRVMQMLEDRSRQRPTAVRRVLVVDDNLDVTQTIAELLRMIGHEVHVAHDGPSALAEATRANPDVVLLDLGLPGMSGFDVARKLREMPGGKEIVIVAVTGWGQPDDLARTQEAGFDHHLVKPAGLVALREILGEGRR